MGRVGSMRLPLFIGHLFRISVVSSDQGCASFGHYLGNDFLNARVNNFACADRSVKNSCMSDHIHVGEVQHNHVIISRLQP